MNGTSKRELLARVQQGRDAVEPVEVPELCNAVVYVRPLTAGQQAAVKAAALRGQVVTVDQASGEQRQTIDVAATVAAQAHARSLAAAFGMVEQWTPEEVDQFPAEAVERIAGKVLELSGLTDLFVEDEQVAEQVATFREDRAGAADRDAAPAGSAAGGLPG